MKTIAINTYAFDELSSEAKYKAMQWYRDSDFDNAFAEYVIEDAATIADLMGLDIRLACTTNGTYAPSVYFSGFCNQGDGACFKGSYQYKKGSAKAVKSYAPRDTELHRIAITLQNVQKKHFYKLRAVTKHTGSYWHEYSMAVDVSADTYSDISDAEELITELLRDFARWIYKQLEAEYEYQNSDESVSENIRINDYDFLASGERA